MGQTCYMYTGFQALAEMKRRAGDMEGAKKCRDECLKIRSALNSILWLPEKGQYASYIEQGECKVPSLNKNIAFTSLWDKWPKSVTIPVNQKGDQVWLLVCVSTNPMQLRIANAVIRFRYADGVEEKLELNPPSNFWALCRFGQTDYNYKRDGFALPKTSPLQVQLGENCRAMVYGWKLRLGEELTSVTLETLSQEVVVALMGIMIMKE